jgi:hypothetical protein
LNANKKKEKGKWGEFQMQRAANLQMQRNLNRSKSRPKRAIIRWQTQRDLDKSTRNKMTKYDVLAAFAQTNGLL